MKETENNPDIISEDDSSSTSSPKSENSPHQSKFKVQVVNAVKDGDTLSFTVESTKVGDGTTKVLERIFEDFEWLHHCLITQNNVNGLIIPPLPLKAEIDPKSAENKSRRQLGNGTNVLVADEFHKECRNLEKYLQLVLAHEVFGTDHSLIKFLSESEPPIRAKIRKGLIYKLSSAVDEARKGNHKDIDDYFQKMRDWVNNYTTLMRDTSNNYNKMVNAQYRVAGCYCHLSTALTQTGLYKDEESMKVNRILANLSLSLDDAKHELETLSSNDEKTLGFHLDLYARYMESVREMLFRRTCLLVDYEDANRMLEKAKPHKRQLAEETRDNAWKLYDDSSEVARKELKAFIKERLLSSREGFTTFAESQIRTAQDTYSLLANHLRVIKEMA